MTGRLQPLVALLLTCTTLVACKTPNPLPRPVACSGIASLRVGDSPDTVEHAIGPPIGRGKETGTTRNAQQFDLVWAYTYANRPEFWKYHDVLDLYFLRERLVVVSSGRFLSGVAHDPAGGNPLKAYRLFADSDGRERREYGPAFEQVFQCEPGFVRPQVDADR